MTDEVLRNNEELNILYNNADTVAGIKSNWMRWLGQVERMDGGRVNIYAVRP